MNYCIVENGFIKNIIVCDSDDIAKQFGAVVLIDGDKIGDVYGLKSERLSRISKSKADLSDYLEAHPLLWTDGEYYSITAEKQNQLMGTLAAAEIDKQPPEWNSSGGVCKAWAFEDLSALAVAIKDRVKSLVKYQQTQEVAMRNATTIEELDAIVVDYDSVPEVTE